MSSRGAEVVSVESCAHVGEPGVVVESLSGCWLMLRFSPEHRTRLVSIRVSVCESEVGEGGTGVSSRR